MCICIHEITVDIRYLEYPLSRTFITSNFLFGPFSILINFSYKSVRYLELRSLELSLCRTIFSVSSVIFGLFPIGYLEHEVFEWIILFISGIRMLITALTKLCSEVCSFFFFNILSDSNMSSVKRQLSVKSLGEKCQALRKLEKRLSNKDVVEKYGVLKNAISTWIKKKSKYFTALEQLSNKKKN